VVKSNEFSTTTETGGRVLTGVISEEKELLTGWMGRGRRQCPFCVRAIWRLSAPGSSDGQDRSVETVNRPE